ncbi:MAG: 50S ribosomal protein L9 [Victivallales bacterium]|nr:50S ribosomal protein L9 [Victivallales bacterium]
MNEKLILLEDIPDLGKAGEIVNVANGYARNYLIPQKLALKASKGAMRQFEAKKEKIDAKRREELKQMKELAEKLEKLEITIPVNVGEDEKLYGSVTTHNIADVITDLGVEISHIQVELDTNIKELGVYDIGINLHPEVTADARVWVVRA